MRENYLDAVEIAQKQRHLYLLTKVKNNRHLSQSELEELKKLEKKTARKKTKKKTGKSAIAAEQIVKGQVAAAKYAGVTVRTIRNWKKEGMPVTEDGGYIKRFLDFYKNNEGKQPTEEKKKGLAADANIKETRYKLLQIELERKLREFDAELERGWVQRILVLKRSFGHVGRKLAPRLAKIKDERKIAVIINDEIRSIIEHFSS